MRYVFAAGALAVALTLSAWGQDAPMTTTSTGPSDVLAKVPQVPEPKIVAARWQLDLDYQRPRMIRVRIPGTAKPQTYWYMLYTVTNKTGADRIFEPGFDLYTDTGQLLHAEDEVSPYVFSAVKRRHNNPLLVSDVTIRGKLLQGEDNAKDGVAIWRDFDPKARAFDVFITGLSGESIRVKLPVPLKETVVEDGKKVTVVKNEVLLRKTLKLEYSIPGDAAARGQIEPKFIKSDWVMR